MISIIVAKANHGVIGAKNDLPWYLPADLKHFRELTQGHTVVMGRNTYHSIVSRLGHALPERRNIVVTRQDITFPDAETIHSINEIYDLEDVFIIGGAELYAATIGIADRLYITEVKAEIDGDTHFPALDPSMWREVSRESHSKDEKNDYDYDFVIYEARRS
jgi:dihydrofolate reductase